MTDVLVIGGGLAGWRAAEAAVKAGCSVTLVANGAGNSPHVHALNCPVRPDDSAERMFADTLASGHGANDPNLVRVLCEGAVRLKDEFPFDRCADGTYEAIRPLGSSVPRCVSINHAIGAWELARLKRELAGKVEVIRGRVTALRKEAGGFTGEVGGEGAAETGAVRHGGAPAAVAAESERHGGAPAAGAAGSVRHGGAPAAVLSARAVVLATGGWCGKYDFSTNPPYLLGDGLALAQSLGAAVRDLDVVQYEPTVRVDGPRRGVPVITTLLHEGAKLRNERGEEFLPDARLNKDELSRAIRKELGGEGTAVLYDLTAVTEVALLRCRMDPAERLIRVAPAPHTSLGGVVVDTRCRVLGSDGTAIPGLFAAGEVTGGLHGLNRLGGNAGTEVMVFGRLAGEGAAGFAKG